MKNCKFLVAGAVKGDFEKLFKKVSSVQKKKGPFDFLLCVGSFFGKKDEQWNHYVKSGIDVPLTVYILGPNEENEREFYPNDLTKLSEINSKIIYIGKKGHFTTCEGLKIGFLSGVEVKNSTPGDWNFDENDVRALLPPRKGLLEAPIVDILITSVWPEGVSKYDKSLVEPSSSSKLLSSALNSLYPWYHFAGMENVFYERTPYSNFSSNGELISATRFIALANVSSKDKWLHALSIDVPKKLSEAEINILYSSITPSPYSVERPKDTQSFRYDLSGKSNDKRTRNGNERKKLMKIDAEKSCWFCLSSGKAENHLIISIGDHAYVSLNRGGLVSQHLNICPIEHVASMSLASEAIIKEVESFSTSLEKYFKKSGFEVIFFERYYKTFHSQIHCIPLLPDMAPKVEEVFIEKVEALENIDYSISKRDFHFDLAPEQNYFHARFPNGSNLLVKINTRFPLNFGREVLVDKTLMNAEEKGDWRNCVLSVEEETDIVNDLRKAVGSMT